MRKKTAVLIVVVAILAIVATSLVFAQSGGGFDLSWNTIDGGGGLSTGGDFELQSTIGQWDASRVHSGGDFLLSGGFWQGGGSLEQPLEHVYLPVMKCAGTARD